MELKIYNRSGELKLTVSTSSSSTWNQELMKECSVSVSFTHPSYVMLDVEDYVLLEGDGSDGAHTLHCAVQRAGGVRCVGSLAVRVHIGALHSYDCVTYATVG